MSTTQTKLIFGALLHDIGKVVYRGVSAQGTHSSLGASFIAEKTSQDEEFWKSVIEQIKYHHARQLAQANIATDSLAYITYFADNVSAGMDRKEEGDDQGFDRNAKLQRIFNILNGHHDENTLEHEDYNKIRERIGSAIRAIPPEQNGIGSLLNLLEATCDKIPSSTNKAELIDVSLFDHAKTTAAIASCLYEYLEAEGVHNYKAALFSGEASKAYYSKQAFLLWSCDLSGIQDFIYQISGSGALKQLRARSFYLEMLLEHCMDELLQRLDLSRCNLLYTGGGHAYALFPNTRKTRDTLESFSQELKAWLVDHFETSLYCACAFVPCSANDLMNKGEGNPYKSLYAKLSDKLSAVKRNRYTAHDITLLNFIGKEQTHDRECTECHRSDMEINDEGLCPLCRSFKRISPELIEEHAVFAISEKGDLALPFGKRLSVYSRERYLAQQPHCDRIYTKEWDTGLNLATYIWMGDYTAPTEDGINDYAQSGSTLQEGLGIERLGVLRADVDNLGYTFAHGLPDDKASISRTATLSRSLSYFFKKKLNEILASEGYRAQIIYSGGDDLFLIGNWSDVIFAARKIRIEFSNFTGNDAITISGGIGMYEPKYPIARMAEETGALEDAAKSHDGKNAVSLWVPENTFGWEELEECIIPKTRAVECAFEENEKGKAFIYKLIELLRNTADSISIPRIAYLLARSFEDKGALGTEASKQFFNWATDEKERKYLIIALEWYIYSIRERG